MKLDFDKMPQHYVVCNPESCQRAQTCLRQLGYRHLEADEAADAVNLLKPRRCSAETDFAYYRSSEPMRFARGLKSIKRNMTAGQYEDFLTKMKEKHNTSAYYRRYSGEILISPEEQQEIANVLAEAGIEEEPTFDAYEYRTNW